jgi:hypothetical protein
MKVKNRDVLLNRVIYLLWKEDNREKRSSLRLMGESLVNEYKDLKRDEVEKMIAALDPSNESASTIGG